MLVVSFGVANWAGASETQAIPKPANSISLDKPIFVNGKKVNPDYIDFILEKRRNSGLVVNAAIKNQIIEDLIKKEIIYQAATKAGLNKQKQAKIAIEMASQEALNAVLIGDLLSKSPITESVVRAEYEEYLKRGSGGEELKFQQIFIPNERDANQAQARLTKGEKIEDLISSNSIKGIRKNSIRDEWILSSQIKKPALDSLQKLKKGEYSKPINMQDGWLILRLDDRRPFSARPYAESSPLIKKNLESKIIADHVRKMTMAAKITN